MISCTIDSGGLLSTRMFFKMFMVLFMGAFMGVQWFVTLKDANPELCWKCTSLFDSVDEVDVNFYRAVIGNVLSCILRRQFLKKKL